VRALAFGPDRAEEFSRGGKQHHLPMVSVYEPEVIVGIGPNGVRKRKHPSAPGREIIPVAVKDDDRVVFRAIEAVDAILRVYGHCRCRHLPTGGNTCPVFVHFISVLAAPNHCFYNGHGIPSSPCCLCCDVGCFTPRPTASAGRSILDGIVPGGEHGVHNRSLILPADAATVCSQAPRLRQETVTQEERVYGHDRTRNDRDGQEGRTENRQRSPASSTHDWSLCFCARRQGKRGMGRRAYPAGDLAVTRPSGRPCRRVDTR